MKEANKTKRVRRDEGQWRTLIARQQTSGLDVASFCRREAISGASLYRWRNLLSAQGNRRKAEIDPPASAFVELGVLNTQRATPAPLELKLELGDGLVLHLVRR